MSSTKKVRRKKVRRFYVWAACSHDERSRDRENILEFSDGETDEEIEAECAEFLETLISNNFDTGWNELAEGEEP